MRTHLARCAFRGRLTPVPIVLSLAALVPASAVAAPAPSVLTFKVA